MTETPETTSEAPTAEDAQARRQAIVQPLIESVTQREKFLLARSEEHTSEQSQ